MYKGKHSAAAPERSVAPSQSEPHGHGAAAGEQNLTALVVRVRADCLIVVPVRIQKCIGVVRRDGSNQTQSVHARRTLRAFAYRKRTDSRCRCRQ